VSLLIYGLNREGGRYFILFLVVVIDFLIIFN
jgi:hypothetical protein